MKVVVTKGYVTVGSNLYGAGTEIELPDGVAKNLLVEGIVALPEMVLIETVPGNPDTEDKKQGEDDTDIGEPDLEPVDLPSADPAAAVKKNRGKKA